MGNSKKRLFCTPRTPPPPHHFSFSISLLILHVIMAVCVIRRKYEKQLRSQNLNCPPCKSSLHYVNVKSLGSFHYEAKLCILCIVSGVRSRPQSDFPRNLQLCYFSLIFFDVLDNKKQIRKTLVYRSKSLQK